MPARQSDAQMKQAIFKKIYVDDEGGVTSEFNDPFKLLLSSEVLEAARDHAKVLDADRDLTERELEALYRAWSEERGTTWALRAATPRPREF